MTPHVHVSNELWWYVARSCGIVSWVVLTASVLWGLLLSSKSFRKRVTPAWVLDLHRYLGGLAVIFVGLHLAGLAGDHYIHFGVTELLVPFASHWRAGAVAWGVAGFYLLLAVELTSLARRRLPAKVWRSVHGLAFVLFASSTAHLLMAGTDAKHGVLRTAALAAAGSVAVATIGRLALARRARSASSARAAALAALAEQRRARPAVPPTVRFGERVDVVDIDHVDGEARARAEVL